MDRVIVYDGALPQTTDILNTNLFAMVAQAFQNAAFLGMNTVVAGLTCQPTTPTASLQVNVGTGSIYQLDPIDASAYGDLGTATANIMKQGLLSSPATLTLTPPATVGYSQIYLVQAALQDVDSGQVVLSYYNSAKPDAPYSGPANSGSSNYTIRQCKCTISLKAGAPAATGSQLAPSVDAGFVGLYLITVLNGTTQITSTNITQLPSAPFFPTLPSVPSSVLNGTWNYVADTGTANHLIATFAPPAPIPSAYVAGMNFRIKASANNSGATDINVNGLGVVAIKRAGGAALTTGDVLSGQILDLTYDGVNFQMANYLGVSAGTTTNNFTSVNIPYVLDTGTSNAIIASYSPAITSAQQVAGLFISVKLANAITGACTINVNGLGVKPVVLGDTTNPPASVFVPGEVLMLVYDGFEYQIVTGVTQGLYHKPTSNQTLYVNNAIGNDANDGYSNAAGHALATIQGGINRAYAIFAPSQYTITIIVEPGTYTENPATPTYAGPNIVVQGISLGSVVVNAGGGYGITVQGPNVMSVVNMIVNTNGVYGAANFCALNGGTMVLNNNQSGASGAAAIFASGNGTINVYNHTFNGSSYAAMIWSIFNSVITLMGSGTNLTIAQPISAGWAFANASGSGTIAVNNTSPPGFPNASYVSGPKYLCSANGVIALNGLGVYFFPGNQAGSVQTGGQYNG